MVGMVSHFTFIYAAYFEFIKAFLTMFISTHVIFCETMCDQMMKNDLSLCEFLLVDTINTGAKHCMNTTVSRIRLCLI
jgi:hypothetical protein